MDRSLDVRAATLWWSAGGNTRKVAEALHEALGDWTPNATLHEIRPELTLSAYEQQLVLLGFPVYGYAPPAAVVKFLKGGGLGLETRLASPERPGIFGVVFCTYAGPHTGVREAVPAVKYAGQFLEHGGIPVVDEWLVVGEFHDEGRARMNLEGRLGDIRGRPNAADLAHVAGRLHGLMRRLRGRWEGGQ